MSDLGNIADEKPWAVLKATAERDLAIVNGWLVQRVDICTCGTGGTGYGHEPGCGFEPLITIDNIERLTQQLKDVADYLDQISDQCLAPPYPVPVPFWVLKIRWLIGHSTSAQSRSEHGHS